MFNLFNKKSEKEQENVSIAELMAEEISAEEITEIAGAGPRCCVSAGTSGETCYTDKVE